jgi:hypothetical protein
MPTRTLFPPPGSEFISLSEAKAMTARYRLQKENILSPEYRNKNLLLTSEAFNKDAFEALLQVEGCAGIRIYFAMNEGLQVKTIGVAINKNGDDILPEQGEAAPTPGAPVIIEHGQTCPPVCPDSFL